MPGKSLTEIKAAELAEIRERMAAEKAERLLLDVRPHDLWWHLGRWTRRFTRIKKALSTLAAVITGVGAVLTAFNGIRTWITRRSVAPAEIPARSGERLGSDRVEKPVPPNP